MHRATLEEGWRPSPPTGIQLCGLLVVELQGCRIEGDPPEPPGSASVRLPDAQSRPPNRARRADRSAMAVRHPTPPGRRSPCCSRSCEPPSGRRSRGAAATSLSHCRQRPGSTSRRRSRVSMRRSRPWQSASGDAPGVPPCALSSSLGGRCCRSTKPRGSTSGAGVGRATRCEVGGSAADGVGRVGRGISPSERLAVVHVLRQP
jgi:hypothetical protein